MLNPLTVTIFTTVFGNRGGKITPLLISENRLALPEPIAVIWGVLLREGKEEGRGEGRLSGYTTV